MDLRLRKNENEEQFIWRIGQAKDSGELEMSWDEIADIINKEFGNEDRPLSEAAFRKPYQQAKKFYDAGVFDLNTNESNYKVYTTETSINKDGTYSSKRLIEMNDTQSKDPSFILKAHGFDDSWKIVSLKNNIRQVISKQDGTVTLYASFLTVKPTDDKIFLINVKNFLIGLIEIIHYQRQKKIIHT